MIYRDKSPIQLDIQTLVWANNWPKKYFNIHLISYKSIALYKKLTLQIYVRNIPLLIRRWKQPRCLPSFLDKNIYSYLRDVTFPSSTSVLNTRKCVAKFKLIWTRIHKRGFKIFNFYKSDIYIVWFIVKQFSTSTSNISLVYKEHLMNCLIENTVQNKNKSLHLCWY